MGCDVLCCPSRRYVRVITCSVFFFSLLHCFPLSGFVFGGDEKRELFSGGSDRCSTVGREMEENKSSLVDELFPRKEIPGKSPLNQQSRGRLQGSDVLITIGKTLTSDPCLMSSSVYYGGRDYFIPECASSYKSGNTCNFKNDKEDDSSKLDVATRGEWWQGSVYY